MSAVASAVVAVSRRLAAGLRSRAPAPAVAVLLASAAQAQQGDGTDVLISTHVYKPNKVAATPERIARLKVPPGYRLNVFAQGLGNARILAVAPDGTIYLSRRDEGDVLMFKDADGDGRADGPPVRVASRAGAHGLAIKDGKLYLATVKEIFVADIRADGTLGPLSLLIGDLPDAGQHPNRTIAFGPDNMLYISAGSTCNACNESNPENATILRAMPDGKSRTIFASGLRNTIGFGWQPKTGELWGMDQGIDFLGDEVQPEELNRIERGKRYGWPHIWGDGGVNPQSTPQGEISKATWKAISRPMVMGYTAHAAAMQMVFYPGGSFPADALGDAFVTMRGSWNRKPSSGYEVVRIRFQNGEPRAFEPFVTGFLTDAGRTHIARPVGLAVAHDGSLLMADDANGVIYRIAYVGTSGPTVVKAAPVKAAPGGTPVPAPAAAMLAQAARGSGVPLVSERDEFKSVPDALTVQSSSFAELAPIPAKYSEYADGVSPPLEWSPVTGAKSYAIIVEDPDAKPYTPVVHWVAWNIPPSMTRLPEGLQEQLRLTDPDGLMQGPSTRGSPGWYGPRPPVGDPPHRYVFQVLALDTLLDLQPGAERDEVLAAARGHVLARGQLIGTFQQTTPPPK